MSKISDQIVNYVDEVQDNIVSNVTSTVTDNIISNFDERLQHVAEYALKPEERNKLIQDQDRYGWKSIHYPNTRNYKESFDNIQDIQVLKSINDAILSRKLTFEDSTTYSTDCNINGEKTGLFFKNMFNNDFDRLNSIMDTFLNNYKSTYKYISSIDSIITDKQQKYNALTNKVDTYKQNYFIDGRKDKYQNNNYDFYKSFNFYILIIYYSLLVIYIIFSDYIKTKKYNNKINNIFILIYISIPIILKHILIFIYNIYIYFIEKFNLQSDIISYPYIIEEHKKYK